ncbi:hypothetical protein [uncultured Campylobacter sp.]|uniref:hypothetical protein n=1 Tax=uncultured Campylobacter sp. TaxID=218934 RepID=UPI00262F4D2C|nr:hypothetical protein [uncultured Campylobacter sp.]
MGYLCLAEFRTSQNRGEIPRAIKAHKPAVVVSQSSHRKINTARQAAQGRQRTTDALRRTAHGEQYKTDGARQAVQTNKRAPGYQAPTSLKFALS